MKLSQKEMIRAKRVLALFMIPIFVLQMASVNLLLTNIAVAEDEAAVTETTPAPASEAPAEEPAPAAPVVASTPEVVAPAPAVVAPVSDPVVATVETPVVSDSPVVAEQPSNEVAAPEAALVENPASQESTVSEPTTEIVTPVAETTKEIWNVDGDKATTNDPVEKGVTYKAPQNDQVTVTFTKLPDNPGTLSIEEIILTDEQVATLGSLSNKAYDITSDMEDGTFEYDLTLPKPENKENVQIKYAEEKAQLDNAETISDVNVKRDNVEASGIDHFTIFFTATYNGTKITITPHDYYQSQTVYAKADGLSGSYYYRLAVISPVGGARYYMNTCHHGDGDNSVPGSYDLVSPNDMSLGTWEVALFRFSSGCSGSGTEVQTRETFNVLSTRATDSATLNGSSSVTVTPGASISAAVTGTIANGDDWRGTQWLISSTAPGSMNCNDTSDIDTAGTYTKTFSITAPSTPGTYNAYFRINGSTSCGSTQEGTLLTMANAVIVNVVKANTTTSITSVSAEPSIVGFPYTVNIRVVRSGSTGQPSGTVAISDGSVSCTTASVSGTGGTSTGSCSLTSTTAGAKTLTATYAGDSNFNGGSGTTSHTVSKKSQTITFNSLSNKTYGDVDFTVSATASSGLATTFSASGDCTVSGATVNITGAGSCDITAHQVGDGTYNLAPDVSRSFNINKAISTTVVTCPVSATYTGLAITPCTVLVSGAGGLSLTPDPGYLANTNVGTAIVGYIYTGDTNHSGSADLKSFNITKATSTVTVTCSPKSLNYTGSEITPCTVSVTGAGGLSLTPTPVYTDNINVGTATASYTYAGDARHASNSSSDTFSIVDTTAPTVIKVDTAHANGVFKAGEVIDFTVTYSESVTVVGNPLIPLNSSGVANYIGGSGTDTLTFRYIVDTGENSSDLDYESGIDHGSIKDAALNNANNLPAIGTFAAAHAIVIDTAAPTVPTLVSPAGGTFLATNDFDFDWDDSTDTSSITYIYQASQNPAQTGGVLTNDLRTSGTLPTSMIHSSGAGDGIWYWQVKAIDAVGNESAWSPIWNVTLDTIAPSIPTHISPADGTYTTTANLTVIDWSDVTDSSTPVSYFYQSSLSADLNTDGSFVNPAYTSGALTTSQIPANGTPEGTYYWHVRAQDSLGNSSAWSTPWRIIVDNTSPTTPGQIGWSTENPPVGSDYTSGTDFADYKTCGQSVNYSPMTNLWGPSTDANGVVGYEREVYSPDAATLIYSSSLSANYVNGGGAVDGLTYWVRVRAYDAAGNESAWTDECAITYDITAPVLTGGTPIITPTNNTTPSYTFNSTEAGVITYGGGCADSLVTNAVAGDNTVTFDVLAEGTYNCTISVTDGAGNLSNNLAIPEFAIDTTEPVVTFIDPTPSNGLITSENDQTFKVGVSDDTASCKLYYGADNIINTATSQVSWGHSYPEDTDGSWYITSPENTVWNFTDRFANAGGWNQILSPITYDMSSAFNGEDMNGNWVLTMSDNVGRDGGSISNVNLVLNGTSYFWSGSAGIWDYHTTTVTIPVSAGNGLTEMDMAISGKDGSRQASVDFENIPEGENFYRVECLDEAGNDGQSETRALTVDTVAPVVDAGANGSYAGPFNQDGSVSDATSGIDSISWSQISGPGTITFGSPNSADTSVSASKDGQYVARLTATDNVGNLNYDEFSFTYDTTKPIVDAGTDKIVNATFLQDATASDATSGIATYAWTQESGPGAITFGSADAEDTTVSADTDGTYIIGLTVTDNVGNSGYDEFTLVWDTTIPTVGFTIEPTNPNGDNDWYDSHPVFTLTANDDYLLDHIEYQLNGTTGSWTTYAGPVTLDDGQWTVYYRSVDAASNISVVGSRDVKVDTNNPDEVSNLDANYQEEQGRIQLTWDVNDDDIYQVYIYRGDNRNFHVNPSSRLAKNDRHDTNFSDNNIEPGQKYFYKLVSTDEAGNKSGARIISIALPVVSGGTAVVTNEGTAPLPEGTVLGAETSAEQPTANEGQVLGSESQNGNTNGTPANPTAWWQNWWYDLLGLIIIVIGGVWFWMKRKKNQ